MRETNGSFVSCNSCERLMSDMGQSFRLFLVSNLSVLKFRIFLLMYLRGVSVMPT